MAIRLTRSERKAQTREQLLQAARVVFLRRGFHGATLDEIAEEAGYTTGAVYSNFAGKDDLFLALLDEQLGRSIVRALENARGADSFDGAVRSNGRLLAELVRREPAWQPLLVEFWTHASRDAALRAEAASRHEQMLELFDGLLNELADRFGLVWTTPPREVARGAQALARGMALERLVDPDGVSAELFEHQFLTFVKAHARLKTEEGA